MAVANGNPLAKADITAARVNEPRPAPRKRVVPHKERAGHRHGRLVALEYVGMSAGGHALWRCLCDCGKETTVEGRQLGGKTGAKSCGCLNSELAREKAKRMPKTQPKHGGTVGGKRTTEFVIWLSMRQRCSDPKHSEYRSYGGRGIQVCERWNNDFAAFLSDMGKRPGKDRSLDRIDVNGDYTPGNVRWATRTQQQNNRRDTRRITAHGRLLSLADASREYGVPYGTLRHWCDAVGDGGDVTHRIGAYRPLARPRISQGAVL